MRLLIFICCWISFVSVDAQQKKVCITVDDLPTVAYGVGGEKLKMDITKGLVDVFKKYQVPAIGYVNEGKLYKEGKLNKKEVALLELWYTSGLELGNHTYSHWDYNKVSYADFTSDILKGAEVTRGLAKKHGVEYKYFRHPFLHTGATKERSDSLSNFLKEHQYIEAPVTIDNTDYLFAKAYSDAYKSSNTELMKKIGDSYVSYMEEKLVFYETMSDSLFNRKMDQILLIHASLLNAHHIEKLIQVYQQHGYTFIYQTEVLKDPAYQEKVTKFGSYGISWMDRWALSKGKRGQFFEGDPETPEFIVELNR